MYVITERHRIEENSGKENDILCYTDGLCYWVLMDITWQSNKCLYRDGRCPAVHIKFFHSQGRLNVYIYKLNQ
jgi:hypothetical protein